MKPFAWSYTALLDYETCPHAYAAKRVYKTVKDEMSPAGVWGNDVHEKLENRLVKGTPLPADMPFEKWARVVERSVGPQDQLKCELQLALNRNFQQVSWFAKDAWCRAIVDVLLLKERGATAFVYDWKTGKVKTDKTQLKLFVGVLSAVYPDIQRFITKFIWLKHDQVTPARTEGDTVMRDWVPEIWAEMIPRVQRMEAAYNAEIFPMTKNGLCNKYCPVITCPHNGRHGK